MSKSLPSSTKFWIITAATILAASGLLAALWPLALRSAHAKSAQLVSEAAIADRGEAQTNYRLSTWLDPGNHAAFTGLARTQVAAGHAEEALASLAKAGEGSEVENLNVRILMELGRNNEAANEAAALVGADRPDGDLMLAVLAYAAAGRVADEALTSRLSSPDALQRVQRAEAGGITLAAELYATGLLRSSSAMLTRLPASYERNVLLARTHYDRHTRADLARGVELLLDATNRNPAGIEARLLLANIYTDQNKLAEAHSQEALIAKIRAGQP